MSGRVSIVTFDDKRTNRDVVLLDEEASYDRLLLGAAIDSLEVPHSAVKDAEDQPINGSVVLALKHTLNNAVDYRRLRHENDHGDHVEAKIVLITDKDVAQEYIQSQTGVPEPFWRLDELNEPGTAYHRARTQTDHTAGEVALFVVALNPFTHTASLGGRPGSTRDPPPCEPWPLDVSEVTSLDEVGDYPPASYCQCALQVDAQTESCRLDGQFAVVLPYGYSEFETVGERFYNQVLCGYREPTTPTTSGTSTPTTTNSWSSTPTTTATTTPTSTTSTTTLTTTTSTTTATSTTTTSTTTITTTTTAAAITITTTSTTTLTTTTSTTTSTSTTTTSTTTITKTTTATSMATTTSTTTLTNAPNTTNTTNTTNATATQRPVAVVVAVAPRGGGDTMTVASITYAAPFMVLILLVLVILFVRHRNKQKQQTAAFNSDGDAEYMAAGGMIRATALDTTRVSNPVITRDYPSANVKITCATSDVDIYYTTDNSRPDPDDNTSLAPTVYDTCVANANVVGASAQHIPLRPHNIGTGWVGGWVAPTLYPGAVPRRYSAAKNCCEASYSKKKLAS